LSLGGVFKFFGVGSTLEKRYYMQFENVFNVLNLLIAQREIAVGWEDGK
jgi:hypothetical protein